MRMNHERIRRFSEAVFMLNEPVAPDLMPVKIIGVMNHLMMADFVAVCTHDVSSDSGDAFMSLPAHAHLLDLLNHLEHFHRLPGVRTKEYFNLTTPFSLLDFMGIDHFKNSVLYELFYHPVDILHHLNLNLNRSANLQIQINISRKVKAYSEIERFMLGLIRPHLMARFDQMAVEHASHPMFGSANLIARQTWLLCDSSGRVHARSHDADAELARAGMRVGASLPVSWMRWFDGRLSMATDGDQTPNLLVRGSLKQIEASCLPNPVSNEHRVVIRPAGSNHAYLTSREAEVFRWLKEHKTNREIAIILGISPATVKVHVERILAKLGAANRHAAASMQL